MSTVADYVPFRNCRTPSVAASGDWKGVGITRGTSLGGSGGLLSLLWVCVSKKVMIEQCANIIIMIVGGSPCVFTAMC